MKQLLFDLSSDVNLQYVGVYYDLTTEKLEVRKFDNLYYPTRNYVTTSTHVGQISTFEAFEDASVVAFKGIPTFPFAEKVFTNTLYGRRFLQPFVDGFEVYPESAAGANDGKIIVHARAQSVDFSNQGVSGIGYSLDGVNYQTSSNVFENLPPNLYTVYVKSGKVFLYDVLVPLHPRYNARWQIENYDLGGRKGTLVIEKLGYSGVVEVLRQAGASPIVIRTGKTGDDRYEVVRGSEAELNLYSFQNYQFLELFTCHEREYRVSFYKQEQLMFRGFILSDVYREPYTQTPYPVNVSSTDGLGTLADTPFLSGGYKVYGRKSLLEVIAICLSHCKLDLDIITSIHSYEENHAVEASDDPLVQTYVDTACYEGLTCYQVIERILKPFRARIRQWMGTWIIEEIGISINKPRVKAWRGQEATAYCETNNGTGVGWRGQESTAYCQQG